MSSEKAPPKQASSSSPASFVVAGACIGGAVATIALRGRGGAALFQRSAVDQEKAIIKQAMESMNSTLDGLRQDVQQTVNKQAMESVNSTLRSLRQDVQQTVTNAESRLGTKLQTQERAIAKDLSSHYKDLNTRLDTVNAARDELSGVSRKMDNLETIFISPKRRGAFGELQLEGIISDVMPPGSFKFQATLSNKKRPDCLLKLPQPIGDLAIDSKFPMKSFIDLSKIPLPSLDAKTESPDLVAARKNFSDNLLKHVKDIADRYIIPGETADSALLFLPSEAIFSEIVEHHASIVTKAYKLRVWIAGPTTLMAVLTTMRGVVRGVAVNERTNAIVSELGAILQDVERLVARADKVERSFQAAGNHLRDMRISIDKVQRKKGKLVALNEGDDDEWLARGGSSDSTTSPPVLGDDESDKGKMDKVDDDAEKPPSKK